MNKKKYGEPKFCQQKKYGNGIWKKNRIICEIYQMINSNFKSKDLKLTVSRLVIIAI